MASAKRVLNDFQRGKLPYFVRPPTLEDDSEGADKTESAEVASEGDALPKEDTLEQVSQLRLFFSFGR